MKRMLFVILSATLLLAACGARTERTEPLKTSIAGVDLREHSQQDVLLPTILEQVERLIGDGRERSARLLASARSDEIREAIITHRGADPAITLMADMLDRLGAGRTTAGGWSAYIRHRVTTPEVYDDWEADVDAIGSLIRQGQWAKAADLLPLTTPKAPGADVLAIESARIAAVVLLAEGQAEEAALAVRGALPLTRSRPGDAPDLKLLLAECERRIPGADATGSWLQAAKLGADPMTIVDPHWLQRLMEARPSSCDYPVELTTEVELRLASALGPMSAKLPAKAVLLAWIGNLLLNRGHGDLGLLICSRAVDACPEEHAGILRLGQARAFAQMRHFGQAQAIVDAVMSSGGTTSAIAQDFARSLAMRRGEIKPLPDDQLVLPRPILGSFVLYAYADRALSLYAAGRTADAMRLMVDVREASRTTGDEMFYAQCLQAELAWSIKKGDGKGIDDIRRRIDEWETER